MTEVFTEQPFPYHKLSIHEEVTAAPSLSDILHGHPMYINVAVHYARPKQATYVRDTLQVLIREIIESNDLDLETDPTVVRIFVSRSITC